MTRQERLEAMGPEWTRAYRCGRHVFDLVSDSEIEVVGDVVLSAQLAGHGANAALDHLAAIEQQAIDAYLAEVPLPDGWTEEDCAVCFRYWEVVKGIDYPIERVYASDCIVRVNSTPRGWSAIPLPVLLRAAVQCHTLRAALHGGEAREGQ